MADEAVIIAGALDAKELENSIDQLVNYVGNKTTEMAGKFEKSMDIMKSAMKDFAVTQKVSVDLMKQAWKEMGASFDAMVQAESAAKGGGGKGKGKTVYEDNTIGALEQSIKLEKERRKEMELGSDVLRTQNNLIMERTNRLKAEKRGQMSLTEVLGMDESSIDAVRLKLNALKFVKIDPNNAEDVKRLGDAYANLSIRQTQMMGKNAQLVDSNQALARSFNYIRNRIVYMLTVGTLGSFVKEIYEVRGQYEFLERSLGVLVNSFEQGKQIFQELNQMSLESPFTLMELAGAAKQLTAYNFSAKEVVDTTRRLADISAALGVPMERLTYNLGQIRAQTVLTARDARDFANAGLPIVKSLSDYYTELEGKVVSTGEVYSRMSKKMVSYSDVMAVLNKMTDEGGKFFEFQAKQAQTLRVQMANLQLAYNNMLNEIGEGNQTAISLPIKGLKLLFQNWDSIGRVLKNIVLTFGLLRVAQMIAIRNNLAWAASATTASRQMDILSLGIKKLSASFAALAANPWTWVFTAIFALSDLIGQYRRNVEEVAKLNEEMRKGAEEASQSNLDFLSNKGNQATLKLAQEGKLTAEQGEKAWAGIKEQIENSAAASDKFIGELLTIEDANERVVFGFNYVENIQKAQAALRDLKDDVIKISQDLGWGGMFGEGLVSDLKDYGDFLEKYSNYFKAGRYDDFDTSYKEALDLDNFAGIIQSDHRKEFLEELEETAQSIKNFIDEQNLTDPLQINEILERVRAIIKLKNPEIKGDLATLFDVSLDQRMFELTDGAVDANTSLWAMFMERLKHNSSAAFQDITDDIYKQGATLTKEQQEAVDKNLEYFKNTMPWYYDAVKKMVDDASKLRINIGIAFNVQQLTDFQNEVNKRILAKYGQMGADQFKAMLPTQNDNLSSWAKTQQDAIAKLQEDNKKYQKDNTAWSKEQIKNNNTEIQQRKNLLDLFKQSYVKEKKGSGSSKDPLGDAVQKNIQYVNEIRKKYEEYRKEGLNTNEALEEATKHYSKSLARVNQELSKYGIQGLTGEQLATMNLQQVRDYFQGLLNGAQGSAKAVEALEKALAGVDGEIIKFRQKAIIDGLNSELGKLKDEYELAVELDANPELGNVFTDMFGIDTTNFPKTIDEFMKRTQAQFNDASKKLKYDVPLDIFKANDEQWIKWGEDVGIVTEQIDEFGNKVKDTSALDKFKSSFTPMIGVAKKWAQDTVKGIQDLQYKLGDYNKKLEIERAKLKVLEDQAANETNANMKRLLELRVQEQKEAIEKLEMESVKLLPFYEDLFGDMYNVSVGKLKQIVKAAKEVMTPRKGDEGIGYTQRKDDKGKVVYDIFAKDEQGNIKKTTVSLEEYIKINKQIDSIQGKIAESSPWEKIKDSFSKKKGGKGIKNFASGMEAIGGELQKVANITKEIGGFAEALGADEETVETINDVATSIGGVATAAQGIGQIAKGDYIGGVASFLSGAVSAITSWLDNSDKKITRQIKESEREVKRLELTYIDLEHAMDEAYGVGVYGAKRAAQANKELQLAELERQLQLEKSRSGKKRDEDKIIDLQKQIKELRYEIKSTTDEIVNDLLGISSVNDWAFNLVSNMIEAFKQGEDYMAKFDESFEDMIDNMIAKAILSTVIGDRIKAFIEEIKKDAEMRGAGEQAQIKSYEEQIQNAEEKKQMYIKGRMQETAYRKAWESATRISSNEAFLALGYDSREDFVNKQAQQMIKEWQTSFSDAEIRAINEQGTKDWEEWVKWLNEQLADHQDLYNKAIAPTPDDIRSARESGEAMRQGIYDDFVALMDAFGIKYGQDAESAKFSSLQAGISSITETTANALEAYMNGVSQQVYLQSDLITQIRDAVVAIDSDVQTSTQAQMLLQLQQSYQVQMSIQMILEGVLTPSGRAFSVELIS